MPRWEVPGWRERFGVLAGVTGRVGPDGVPFDLGLASDQPVGEVMSRWRTFRAAFPECPGMVSARQVHGADVLWHAAAPGWTLHAAADGHATTSRGILLLVTVADCVPVYLVDRQARAVALLHAGWRGTAGRILARGVELLRERAGVFPADLVMHAGVAISGPRYEVGAEVIRGVGRDPVGEGPWHLDLREVLAEQARGLGVGEVTVSGHCTAGEREAFFSHRGSGGRDGRMVAWLGFPQVDGGPPSEI